MHLLNRLCNTLQVRPSPASAAPSPATTAKQSLPEDFVIGSVLQEDGRPEATRLATGGYMHVSSLPELCLRQQVLAKDAMVPLVQAVTGGHRVMWRIGRAVEAHIREQLVKTRRSDLFGDWRCLCQHSRHVGHYPQGSCPKCESWLSHYHELPLFDHQRGVVGNPDCLIRHEGKLAVLEIKSMNSAQWKELTGPLGNHVFQMSAYAHLLRLNGYATHDQAVIVYATKDFKFGSPYKEFHVDTTEPTLVARIEDAFNAAAQLRAALLGGTLPPRTLCTSPTSALAKTCPLVATCFNRS